MALQPIYEQDFYDCSYGFRPGRSAHQALLALWQQTMALNGGWLVEVDIRKFFDTLDRAHLRVLLRRRVRDGVLLRLIDKWLQSVVQRRTMRSRFTRGLRRVRDWLRKHLHEPVRLQHRRLCQALLGHYAYFGVTGNVTALARYREAVKRIWRRWLARRRRGGYLSWDDFASFLQRFPLPPPRVVHSVYRS